MEPLIVYVYLYRRNAIFSWIDVNLEKIEIVPLTYLND